MSRMGSLANGRALTDAARFGLAGGERKGKTRTRTDADWLGKAGREWRGADWSGLERSGVTRRGRYGKRR